MAVRLLIWNEIIDEVDDDDSWADPGVPSSARSHPGNGNDNDYGDSEEDTPASAKGTRKWKGT